MRECSFEESNTVRWASIKQWWGLPLLSAIHLYRICGAIYIASTCTHIWVDVEYTQGRKYPFATLSGLHYSLGSNKEANMGVAWSPCCADNGQDMLQWNRPNHPTTGRLWASRMWAVVLPAQAWLMRSLWRYISVRSGFLVRGHRSLINWFKLAFVWMDTNNIHVW
jgi:hypothetical protein